MSSEESQIRSLVVEGTDLLIRGRAEEALQRLEQLPPGARPRAHRLALGKACLECGRAAEAQACFESLLADPPEDPGERAYLRILTAAALARQERTEEARRHLDEAVAADRRLERAARALRKRIDAGRLPLVRL